jgi:hypothetical protein
MPNIVEFLAHLVRDQAAYKAFQNNPDVAMVRFGLDAGQIGDLRAASGKPADDPAVAALENRMKNEHMAVGGAMSMTTKLMIPAPPPPPGPDCLE